MQQNEKKSRKRRRRSFTAAQKCQAVLQLWSQSRSMSELARELQISYTTLDKWQTAAMAAMMKELAPKTPTPGSREQNLNPRLQKLLSRFSDNSGSKS